MTVRPTYYLAVFLLFSLAACTKNYTEGNTVPDIPMPSHFFAIDLSGYTSSSGNIVAELDASGRTFLKTEEGEHWMAFDVQVPATGRYKLEIHAATSDSTSVWIEDYYDNPDDRVYNITGTIEVLAEHGADGSIYTKVGSPLKAGLHRIKLHVKGKAVINDAKFTLIRAHRPTPTSLTQYMDGTEWEIVWSDEFEGSGLPDTTKWTYDLGNWGWGNNELQFYTEGRTENARLENGYLIIEAHKNDMSYPWTSARLTTRGKVSFTYGRIEFKAMVPAEKGNWAAGWTLGDDYIDERSWPYCGEIDILESVGYQMENATGNGKAHASVHCGAYYFKLGNQPTATTEVSNMNNTFHTYAVNWTPQGITAYVDEVPYLQYTDTSTPLSWPFDKPQNIILNLAMGGGWGGLEGMDETVTSQKMVVDYVRVYQKKK